jgi:hypothetical protein
MIHTSTVGGYGHQTDSTVVATFILSACKRAMDQGAGLPAPSIANKPCNACVSLDPCQISGGLNHALAFQGFNDGHYREDAQASQLSRLS